MKLHIIKLLSLVFLLSLFYLKPDSAQALTSPLFYGHVYSQTGAPIQGAYVAQYSSQVSNTGGIVYDQNGNPVGTSPAYATSFNRSTTTDLSGFYSFGRHSNFQCTTNPQIFRVSVPNGSCPDVTDNPGNVNSDRIVDIYCNVAPPPPPPPPPACNTACTTDNQCATATDGCTSCVNNSCQKLPVCGEVCTTPADCASARDGCTQCLPNTSGTGNICQPPPPPACNSFCATNAECALNQQGCTQCVAGQCRVPPACNVDCTKDEQCTGARDGCTVCLPGDNGVGKVCRPPAACNVSCVRDDQCAGAKDGCTVCLPSDSGTGNVCRPAPACNVACTKDGQCVGAKDGCTACVSGTCRIPPACGVACTSKADCAGAKDSCSQCLEGTCTDYNDNMCKCDGLNTEIMYPSTAFKFEAFGKVDGKDAKKAEIADITFRMTKDNLVIAKSNPITPEIVESSSSKVRFKAAWSTAPPQVSKNSIYRVFADVRCKPKKITASLNQSTDPNAEVLAQAKKLSPPKGLQFISDMLDKLTGQKNWAGRSFVGEVMAQLSSPTPTPGAGTNLQLKTLNFVKLLDTDNCRFVMFKFDETLF